MGGDLGHGGDLVMTWVRDATRMTKRTLFRLLNLLGVLVAVLAAVPFGARLLEPRFDTPVPQLAAFGTWTLPLWVLAGVLLLVGRSRRGGGVVLAVIVLVVVVGVRWQVPSTLARAAVRTSAAAGVPLRVMTVNVEFGQADAAQAVALVREHQVDVLVVEEMTPDFVDRLQGAGIGTQLRYSDLHPQVGPGGTGIWSRWVVRSSGALPSAGFEMPMASITLPGGSARTLTVTGIHTQAPTPRSGPLTGWRRDLSTIAKVEASRDPRGGPAIYAGDFNASRDHAGFRAILATGLVDAADAVPAASWPGFTWPADRAWPAFTRIDHVLLTPSSIGVRNVTVLNLEGTDHHPVVADLVVLP